MMPREWMREYQKKWGQEHSEELREYHKKWCQEHPDKVREYTKRYRESHREQMAQRRRDHPRDHRLAWTLHAYHFDPKVRAKRLAQVKAWHMANRESILIRRREQRLKRQFGLSVQDWDRMFQRQGEVCALCKKPPNNGKKRLAVDHNHRNGKVRGLLCDCCNRMLGTLETRVSLLDLYIYLTRDEALM